ncbi:AraC family transcriptional regulator [Chitinophaga pendula]|uniref:AraC family transcriptional regulator n=1 Tax=Chitinophaga TaxID=79328 RepID=UPI000BAFC68F|nr:MULTISPECIES: AraC family transcriptional regulator [Chitinophaga]ASZ13007.1 hypothetical protein CK934_19605 [Chitinophaga sp. MD30]UCJ09363.1 AraC family transcriptional regulator [Chitinophaga pendula]
MMVITSPNTETAIDNTFSIRPLAGEPATDNCRLVYHRIIYVLEGTGNLQIDDQSFPVNGQQLYLIARGQVYRESPGLQWSGYLLSFADCFWERTPASANNCKAVLFNNAADNQCLPLAAEDRHSLLPLFQTIQQEAAQASYINQLDVLAAYLKIIMIKIANINAALVNAYDTADKQLYRQFVELVSEHYHTLHEVADYAGKLHITPRRLSDLCRRCAGRGAKDIINGQLIAAAKRHLQFSSIAVKEIAYQLNFTTPEQFSHFFKKNVNSSPSDYRSAFINQGK